MIIPSSIYTLSPFFKLEITLDVYKRQVYNGTFVGHQSGKSHYFILIYKMRKTNPSFCKMCIRDRANRVSVEGNGKILLNKDLQYSGIYTIKNPGGPQNRVRVYSVFSCEEKEWTDWKQAQFIIKFYRGETAVSYTHLFAKNAIHSFLQKV